MIRNQRSEVRYQRAEGRGQRTEDRGQRTEDRGQRAGRRGAIYRALFVLTRRRGEKCPLSRLRERGRGEGE